MLIKFVYIYIFLFVKEKKLKNIKQGFMLDANSDLNAVTLNEDAEIICSNFYNASIEHQSKFIITFYKFCMKDVKVS